MDSIRWAQVKSTDRAVEKIIRVYAQVFCNFSAPALSLL